MTSFIAQCIRSVNKGDSIWQALEKMFWSQKLWWEVCIAPVIRHGEWRVKKASKELREVEEHMSFKDERSSSDLSKKEDISFQAETENNSSKFNFLMVMYEMGRNSYVIHFKQNMVLLSGVWCSYCILWDTERWQSEQVYLLIWQKSYISLYMNFSNQKKSHISIYK